MTVAANRPDADTALGRVLHQAMWDQRVTQIRLAAELGIDQSALSKKLRGLRPWTFAEFIACADFLGVDARKLLTDMWGPDGRPGPSDPALTPPFRPGPPSYIRPRHNRSTTVLALAA